MGVYQNSKLYLLKLAVIEKRNEYEPARDFIRYWKQIKSRHKTRLHSPAFGIQTSRIRMHFHIRGHNSNRRMHFFIFPIQNHTELKLTKIRSTQATHLRAIENCTLSVIPFKSLRNQEPTLTFQNSLVKLNCFILRTTTVAGLGVPIFRVFTVYKFVVLESQMLYTKF